MKHLYSNLRTLIGCMLVSTLVFGCVDSAYDLGNISLKITLGPNGVSLPLGKVDSVTVDSLIRRSEFDDLILEDGFYAYKLDGTIDEAIDAVTIDPISNVIPALKPHIFHFSGSALPETISAAGFSTNTEVTMPSFDFTEQSLDQIDIDNSIFIDDIRGRSYPINTPLPTLYSNGTEDFTLQLSNIPQEIASIDKIYFTGAPEGTPVHIGFQLGALASSAQEGEISISITLPPQYILTGNGSSGGNTIRITNHPISGDADLLFYIAERTVDEQITNGNLTLSGDIVYLVEYTGISNGTAIPNTGDAPLFTIMAAPQFDDADIHTNQVVPQPSISTTPVRIEADGLTGIQEVNYIAFSGEPSDALTLQATHDDFPMQGDIPVEVTFPAEYEFAPGIEGLSGRQLTTSLDQLTTGVRLPLLGLRLSGTDAHVTDGAIAIEKPIEVRVSPRFAGAAYKLSALTSHSSIPIEIAIPASTLHIDAEQCQIVANFSTPVEFSQKIDNTFEIADEVSHIVSAEVIDALTGSDAVLTIALDIEDAPIDHCYFDDIKIALPHFVKARHTGLDAETNTIHISRVEYQGRPVVIARIVVEAIRDIDVTGDVGNKVAHLAGDVTIDMTVSTDNDAPIGDLEQTELTLLPNVDISTLRIIEVSGKTDIDLQKYLTPTIIKLDDIRESLGDSDVEINLVAPQIYLSVHNPVGVAMVGDITLQPYDFSDAKLDPVVIKNISIEPATDVNGELTKLFVTDGNKAPEGYTLCQVEELSKLVRTIPSKFEVSFDLAADDTREQRLFLTGQDYSFQVDYSIKIPLRFQDNASIRYTDTYDVEETFSELDNYDITAEDILITLDARSTLPMDLELEIEPQDANKQPLKGVKATVVGAIEGYNPQTDGGEYKQSTAKILVEIENGDLKLLQQIKWLSYTMQGSVQGSDAGLMPEQYIDARMKLHLKKGITIDLKNIETESDLNK